MIIGIGSDLIDIRRIEKVIERHGERFLDRIFTELPDVPFKADVWPKFLRENAMKVFKLDA